MTPVRDQLIHNNDGTSTYFRNAILAMSLEDARELAIELEEIIARIETDLEWRDDDKQWERSAIAALRANKANLVLALRRIKGGENFISPYADRPSSKGYGDEQLESASDAIEFIIKAGERVPEELDTKELNSWAHKVTKSAAEVKGVEALSPDYPKIRASRIAAINNSHIARRLIKQRNGGNFNQKFLDAARSVLTPEQFAAVYESALSV